MSTNEKTYSFLAPRYTTHSVGGRNLKFYAVSTQQLFRLKTFATPIALSLATIMGDRTQDIKRASRDFQDARSGDMGQETILDPVSPAMAKHRDGQRSEAIEQLIAAVTDPDSHLQIGALICDSLREEFPERPVPDEVIRAFMDNEDMSLPVLVELITGVASANKGAFGPLAGPLAAKMKRAVGDLEKGEDEDGSENKETSEE